MEKQEYEVGDYIEARCETCEAVRGQIVASVGAKNQITRITCPRCGNKNRFKISLEETRIPKDYAGASKIYNPAQKYAKGEIIEHPSFGFGEVVSLVDPGKIEVLFEDRLRCLIHGR